MLVLVEVQVAFGLLIFLAEYTVGRGELGHDQAAPAKVADEAAEHSVGHSGHGGEDGCGGDVDGPDRKTCGDGLQQWCLAGGGSRAPRACRVVTELAHVGEESLPQRLSRIASVTATARLKAGPP